MIRSAPILPIRFYDDLFDQDRFNKFHDRRYDTPLCYPTSKLPSFQMLGPIGTIPPTDFVLKKVCDEENHYKIIPEGVSNFEPIASQNFIGDFFLAYEQELGQVKGPIGYYDNGVDPPVGVNAIPVSMFSCGKLVGGDLTNYTYAVGPPPYGEIQVTGLTASNKHNFKIIVEKFQNVSTGFSIKIYNGLQGGTLLATITKAGVYSYDFTAASTMLTVVFDGYAATDYYELSYWQVTKHLMTSASGDVTLDVGTLQSFILDDGRHLIAFCDPAQDYTVPEGDYYYVIKTGNGSYYCSEVFSIKSLRELEKYYVLTWWNSCDIGSDVVYNTDTLPCEFKNKLYLDAALFKPEYNTGVENITDGENTNIPVFKKWQKFRTLEIVKTPEFLVDALSGLFLHDNIYLQEPLHREQVNRDTEYFIEEVIPDVAPVLLDAYQKVTLKLLLSDAYVKTNCCEEINALPES